MNLFSLFMKRKISCGWPLLLAVALGRASMLPAIGQESHPMSGTNSLTLESAIRLALARNPWLSAAANQVTASAGRAHQSKMWPNPDLELSAEEWPTGGGGFQDAKKLVGVSQTFPFPGKKRLDGEIGEMGVRVSQAEYDLRRVELVRDVKTAFFEVLAAERMVAVARELVAVAESSAATARKQVQAGAAADQEQLRAEIPLEQARTELAGFEREEDTARQKLANLLGVPDFAGATIVGALAEAVSLAVLDSEPEHLLTRHPGVIAARAREQRAEAAERRARLEPYPDVKLGAAGGHESEGHVSFMQFGVSLPLPIIDRSRGRRQEARAETAAAGAKLAAIEQQLLRDWRTASQRLRTAAQQVTAYRERILPKANEALRLVQRGFEEGKFRFIDLLDTQRTAAEARLGYQQKLLELNIAQANIEALLTHAPGENNAARGAQAQETTNDL